MRPHHHTLSRRRVHRSATDHLQQHVPLRDYKRKLTAPTLWAVLLVAAAEVTSIPAACARLDGLPSEETIRQTLDACLPEFAELQRQLNRALAGRLPRALRRRRRRLAIDLTLIPYHGFPGISGPNHESAPVALLQSLFGAHFERAFRTGLRPGRPPGRDHLSDCRLQGLEINGLDQMGGEARCLTQFDVFVRAEPA